jgi:hypothetical protein
MPSRRPIPLYPQPPFSPCQTPGEPLSDESDFPPIRIREDVTHVSIPETHCHPVLTPGSLDRLTMNQLQIPHLGLLANMQ